MPNATPYRTNEAKTPTAPVRPERLRHALGVIGIVAAAAALVIPMSMERRTSARPDAPPELIDGPGGFPYSLGDLPPATPLEPLLATDRPDRLALLGPGEGTVRVHRSSPVEFRFNRPMVEGARIGHAVDPAPIVFDPPVAGAAMWTTRSSLSFTAVASTWDANVETHAHLAPTLRSLAGEAIDDDSERTLVFAGTPSLISSGGMRRVAPDDSLELEFEGPVDLGSLRWQILPYEHDGGDRPLPFTLRSRAPNADAHSLVDVRLARTLEPGSHVSIFVAPSLLPYSNAGTTVEFEFTPRPRLAGFACPMRASAVSECTFQAPPGQVVDIGEALRVVATVPLAAITTSNVRIAPDVSGLEVQVDAALVTVRADWDPSQVYEVRFDGLRDTADHALARTPPLAVRSAGHDPEIQASSGRFAFESDAPTRVRFAGIHLDHAVARYQAIAPGDELRTLLALTNDDIRAAHPIDTPLAALASRARPNRWGRGEFAWIDASAGRTSSLATLQWITDTSDEEQASHAPISVFQRTDLGITARLLDSGLLVWTTGISNAMPIAGALVTVAQKHGQVVGEGRTDRDGVVWIPLAHGEVHDACAIRATHGDDRSVIVVDPRTALRPSEMGLNESDVPALRGAPAASAMTDHGIYRPGETVRAKVFLRTGRPDALHALRDGEVIARMFAAMGTAPIAERRMPLSAFGTADAVFALEARAPLGAYRIEFFREGIDAPITTASFEVTEYRQPTMRVDLRVPFGELAEHDILNVPVVGAYLFGAPVRAGRVNWSIARETGIPMPMRWTDYVFTEVDAAPRDGTVDSGEFVLDDQGDGQIATHVELAATVRERNTLEVTVRDDAGHEISARRAYTVFPGDVELGVHGGPDWIDPGVGLDIDAVAISHDGTPAIGRPIEAQVVREGWHAYWEWSSHARQNDGGFQQRRAEDRVVMTTCSLVSTTEPVHCRWMPTVPGTYVLEASTRDEQGRAVTSSRRVYVAGPGEHPDRDAPSTTFSVTPSRTNWRVGETARIAFESPWPDARALITVENDGVLRAEQRVVHGGGNVFEFAITPAMIPNVAIAVELVRGRTAPPSDRVDLGAPDLRVGAAEITVRPAIDPLAVTLVVPSGHVSPGAQIPVHVEVRDAAGRGVRTELAVYAVDEGTLRLSDYATPDPSQSFFRYRAAHFAVEDLRRMLVSRVTPAEEALPGGDGGGDASGGAPHEDRDRSDPTILWLPRVVTDAQGLAQLNVTAPDRAGQYRFMVVAIDDGIRTARAASNVTVTRPVVVRPAFPQAVTEGDRFEAVAFVHNTTESALAANVTITIDGVVRETRSIDVSPGADVRLSQWIDAAGSEQTVRFEATAAGVRDVTQARIPVAPRGRLARALTVGQVRGSKEVTIALPQGTLTRDGAVTLTVATHPFVGFRAALDAIDDDTYRSAETLAYRALALAAYASIRSTRTNDDAQRRELRARGEAALAQLEDYVTQDGTMASWPGAEDGSAHETLIALRAVSAAQSLGWTVAPTLRERLLAGVQAAGTAIEGQNDDLHWRDDEALAARVLSDAGTRDATRIDGVYARRNELSPYGMAQLALAMEPRDLRRETLVLAAQGALSAHHVVGNHATGETYGPGSTTSSLGAVLEAASRIDEGLPGARAEASALLGRREAGRATWGTIDDTGEALVGLAAYASRFRIGAPIAATVLVDGHAIQPRSRSRDEATYALPFAALSSGSHRLVIRAPETAYFALDARWYAALGPQDLVARGRTVALHRVLETESGMPLADGAHVHVGERLRVRLFVYDEHEPPAGVAIHDPLCGGCEPLDAGLETTPRASLSAMLGMSDDDNVVDPRGFRAWQSLDLITHRAFASEATTFYVAHGSSGLHEYTYAVRATNAGTYTLAPARIEALNQPNYVARSALATLIVEP